MKNAEVEDEDENEDAPSLRSCGAAIGEEEEEDRPSTFGGDITR